MSERRAAVLVAPPGAGKTTRVPLDLLQAPWRGDDRILVLEPRRIAARAAATRMAAMLGERLGGRVGLRARFATHVSSRTRVEVVTEGVFVRMILADPALDGIAAVVFDEFHERALDTDAGLAFALDARAGLREDLRLLVMSATLDATNVSKLVGHDGQAAPVIVSEGRAYPVETKYAGRDPSLPVDVQVADAVIRALRNEPGSVLVFLPGQAEIRRTERRLVERISGEMHDVIVAPLYGSLAPAEQDRAIRPAPEGIRKVVLATDIAETSLTIEGVRVVIDAGLARVPRYEPGSGITRLETVRASRASVDQRRGRAGRTAPGVCYRLWDKPQTNALPAFAPPEIMAADLTGLYLVCADWGVRDPSTLRWPDAPPSGALAAARAELHALGALDGEGRITHIGRQLRALPLPPRLAHMIIAGAELGDAQTAADIAAIMAERALGGRSTDLMSRLEDFKRNRGERARSMRRLAERWADTADRTAGRLDANPEDVTSPSPARILATAFPDRIAMARVAPGHYVLANGRGARLDEADPLARSRFLVVADLQGAASATRILLATTIEEAEIEQVSAASILESEEYAFDGSRDAVSARLVRRLGAIVLSSAPVPSPDPARLAIELACAAVARGIDRLPWSKAARQLRARAAFLADDAPAVLPDLSDEALVESAQQWLAPFLIGKSKLADITPGDLTSALDALLPYNARQSLEAAAPTHFEAPTGNRHAIRYDGEHAPSVSLRVQELFGLQHHPAIAGGARVLTLVLLSPASRPIQITRDLPGFWAGSWASVKAELKGRYPKHPWPDDPRAAATTARAKPRRA